MPDVGKSSMASPGTETDRYQRKRRPRAGGNDKKIADDEFMAAAIGDVEWLKQSLRDARGQINFDKNGLTSLHLAAIHGRLECLRLLIEKYKFDINLPSTTGWRAAHLCISNQTGKRALQCLSYLLSKKADASVANNDGITPVHQAASEGHVQCLKELIDIGAAITGKDCRGHTPLDLAKLWGHKKCARILAAESWHQGKDHVAKEMDYLKKLKMQQVMKEMEDDEEKRAAQEFYGEKAYQEWLHKQKLPPQNTGPKGRDRTEKPTKPAGESLHKPNSKVQRPDNASSGKSVKSSIKRQGSSATTNVHVAFRTQRTPSPVERRPTTFSHYDDDLNIHERKDETEGQKARLRTPPYINPEKWKIPLKVPKNEYIVNLKDDYPRDPFTRMPKLKSAPMYYTGKHAPSIYVTDDNAKTRKLKVKVRDVDLPNDVVDKVLMDDPSRTERPVLFKSIHMSDVTKKKKYELEERGRSEVSLHICDDFKSLLFQESLQRANSFHCDSSSSSSKTPVSGGRKWSSARVPRERVVNAFLNMNEPRHYPNIKGEEYDINFGEVSII
ncbi:ankyrin repeat domain-containing protein 53-like [Pecten maximus]|uniref:ankyrin repeat domain-containing protein 53-like n=1 Tax=Pecten maximus TaxID=6579 RepID=UPI0014589D45|nr:ankyrin repeat domain-containing protein 53-like [Pecten maximus]